MSGASSQPPAQSAWPRYPADAGEVRPRLLEGTEERLPRRGVLAHLDGEYLKVAIAVALRPVVATLLDESEPRCSAEIIGHRLVDASRIGGPHCDLDNAVLIIAQ